MPNNHKIVDGPSFRNFALVNCAFTGFHSAISFKMKNRRPNDDRDSFFLYVFGKNSDTMDEDEFIFIARSQAASSKMNIGPYWLVGTYNTKTRKGSCIGYEEDEFFKSPINQELFKKNYLRFLSYHDQVSHRLTSEGFGVKQDLKIFCTLKLGTGPKDADGFRTALSKADCNIGDWGNDILGKPAFKVAEAETEVELVVVSLGELGFKDGATRADIYKRANKLGLDLCPNEVGPQLPLQYKDQPKGEWLLIAMEPITDLAGGLRVFNVVQYDSGRLLDGTDGYPDGFWDAGYRWVFLRRK